jgi:hypothetical protein
MHEIERTYRGLAEEYRRLAIRSSTEMRDRYLGMAEYYSRLAEAEELRAQVTLAEASD